MEKSCNGRQDWRKRLSIINSRKAHIQCKSKEPAHRQAYKYTLCFLIKSPQEALPGDDQAAKQQGNSGAA